MQLRLSGDVVDFLIQKSHPIVKANKTYRKLGEALAIDLADFELEDIVTLHDLIEKVPKQNGYTKHQAREVRMWLSVMEDASNKIGKLYRLPSMLREFLKQKKVFRLYKRETENSEIWLPYAVVDSNYYPGSRRTGPSHATVSLVYYRFGKTATTSFSVFERVVDKTIEQVLFDKGFRLETKELYQAWEADCKRYLMLRGNYGFQVLGTGVGLSETGSFYKSTQNKQLMVDGVKSRLVVHKEDEKEADKSATYSAKFWESKRSEEQERLSEMNFQKKVEAAYSKHKASGEDPDDFVAPDPDEEEEEGVKELMLDVPLHAYTTFFDLEKHYEINCHVRSVEDYVYDEHLADKLVLEDDVKDLVDMLLDETAGNFKDIVAGKNAGTVVLLRGPPGTGKCLGKDTPILMFDGSVKMVQDVVKGDQLMGPDSKPREVLRTNVGCGPLFRIDPVKGKPWVCNDVHMMTVMETSSPRRKRKGELRRIIDIPLNDLLTAYKDPGQVWKLWRTGVEWTERPTTFDPYFIGLWIGDGSFNRAEITSADSEIIEYCKQYAKSIGLQHSFKQDPKTRAQYIRLVANTVLHKSPNKNPLRQYLMNEMAFEGEKAIATEYLINSREKRLQLLAGILDTDGSCGPVGGFDITQKSELLADQISFLARSLGFHVTANRCIGYDQHGTEGEYVRMNISGEVSEIPTRLTRKHAAPRKQIKRHNVTGWNAEPIGEGDYYGFTLDGDGRFLLGDFTVTHNTLTAEVYSERCKRPLYKISSSQLGTSPSELEEELKTVLERAALWNALLLIDECDVFVHKRGENIEQNAVVGIILRVLEYFQGVLFLTTNRETLVDDAILSRCTASIRIDPPGINEAIRIWEILSSNAGIKLTEAVIHDIVGKYPNLVGRDIKNILKLGNLIVRHKKQKEFSLATVDFVVRFMSTTNTVKEDELKDFVKVKS